MTTSFKKLEVKILNQAFYKQYPLPSYATPGSAAMDLRAALAAQTVLEPGASMLVPTGLAIHIADRNFAGFIMPRSGLGHKHGVVLGNLIGVIDSDYQDEVKVSLWNRSQKAYQLLPGERIAQLILAPVQSFSWVEVQHFDQTSERIGGFGHSGRL